jgi:hypothetical protein
MSGAAQNYARTGPFFSRARSCLAPPVERTNSGGSRLSGPYRSLSASRPIQLLELELSGADVLAPAARDSASMIGLAIHLVGLGNGTSDPGDQLSRIRRSEMFGQRVKSVLQACNSASENFEKDNTLRMRMISWRRSL